MNWTIKFLIFCWEFLSISIRYSAISLKLWHFVYNINYYFICIFYVCQKECYIFRIIIKYRSIDFEFMNLVIIILSIYAKNFIQNKIKAWEIITYKTEHVIFTFNITPVYIVSQLGYIILQWCIIKFYTYFILSKVNHILNFFLHHHTSLWIKAFPFKWFLSLSGNIRSFR